MGSFIHARSKTTCHVPQLGANCRINEFKAALTPRQNATHLKIILVPTQAPKNSYKLRRIFRKFDVHSLQNQIF